MPELPEVETYKRYINSTSLNKTISGVIISSPELLRNISSKSLIKKLVNSKFINSRRHGKYLFLQCSSKEFLIMHFGMTGSLKYFKSSGETPAFTRMEIKFENGRSLAYICLRKLGIISYTENIEKYLTGKRLGPDALSEQFDFNSFSEIIKAGRGAVKSFFLNQKHIAGVGNIYTDEILFSTGIYPTTDISKLKAKNIRQLFHSMKEIFNVAVEAEADFGRMPSDYLLQNRKAGAECPVCGGMIKKTTVAGRPTYFCGSHQK